MTFSFDISLTHRASIAVVSSLWNKEDITADIKSLLFSNKIGKRWSGIENNVLLNLKKIILPDILKLNLENLVQPMGTQILKWISFTGSIFRAYLHLPESIIFYWTERGTLDYIRTTEYIIENSSDKTLCFCLACLFCIEKTIFELWPKVGQTVYESIKTNSFAIEAVPVIYWVYYLNDEIENLMTLTEYCGVRNAHEFAFLLTLENAKCITTLSYFLEHIQPEGRQRLVLLALHRIFRSRRLYDGNVLVFLFGYLKEPEINLLIKENSYSVLSSLLKWPCQEFFMSVANSCWNQLSTFDYENLFHDIAERVSRYSVGNIYKNLIKIFWQSSPSSFREFMISMCRWGMVLSRLFLLDNTDEIVEMLLVECSPNERRKIIFYFEGMNICDLLVKREKWNSLKLFITSCISSRDILEEFIIQYEATKPCYYNSKTDLRTDLLIEKSREWFL